MRFKAENSPAQGDVRCRTEFAWLPIRIDDTNTIVWLESYIRNERFIADRDGNRWVTTSTELADDNGSWVSWQDR